MSIRRLPLQRMSYLVSYNDVFFINRSRVFERNISHIEGSCDQKRKECYRRPLHAERQKHSERRKNNPQVFSIVNFQTVMTIW